MRSDVNEHSSLRQRALTRPSGTLSHPMGEGRGEGILDFVIRPAGMGNPEFEDGRNDEPQPQRVAAAFRSQFLRERFRAEV